MDGVMIWPYVAVSPPGPQGLAALIPFQEGVVSMLSACTGAAPRAIDARPAVRAPTATDAPSADFANEAQRGRRVADKSSLEQGDGIKEEVAGI